MRKCGIIYHFCFVLGKVDSGWMIYEVHIRRIRCVEKEFVYGNVDWSIGFCGQWLCYTTSSDAMYGLLGSSTKFD